MTETNTEMKKALSFFFETTLKLFLAGEATKVQQACLLLCEGNKEKGDMLYGYAVENYRLKTGQMV